MSKSNLRIVPLGGLGAIGKNMLVVENDDDMIIVDVGVMFPGADTPGIDVIIPDLSYVLERREKLRGVMVTHGHEDHIGAIPYLINDINVPIYASTLAMGLVKVKLRERHLLRNAEVHEVSAGAHVDFGRLDVEFFRVCHSIPDAMGLAIRTPRDLVVHTGDFKFDHTPVDGKPSDLGKLASLGEEGVDLLLSDSTYAEVPGYTPSEKIVGETLQRVIGAAEGRVIVATFASLIARVQQIADAAVNHKRRIGFVGRSMVDNCAMAIKLGYLNIPPGAQGNVEEINNLPGERAVLITTGAQGEPTSALVRMARSDHRDVTIRRGDTVIFSSSPIPGNERLVNDTINNLTRLGAHVLYDRIEQVHVHGHAAREELKTMLSLTKPRNFVPVHGEYRHLVAHAGIAQSMGVPQDNVFIMEDGDVLEMRKDGAKRAGRVDAGPIDVDGHGRWSPHSSVLKDRRQLARDGIVVAVVTIDKETRRMVGEPNLWSYGVLDTEEARDVIAEGREVVGAAIEGANGSLSDIAKAEELVRDSLRHYFSKRTKRRPTILPVAVEA